MQSALVALSASLATSENLLGSFVADWVEETALAELVGDAFVDPVLEVVDTLDASDFCLIEFIWTSQV